MKRTERKRKDIIDAAVEEFTSHGFEGARTSRIAKSAKVSSRTLFNHFPTKDAMFEEIIEIIVAKTGEITSEPFDPKLSLRGQLIAALEAYIEAITDENYLALNRMTMSEFLRDPDLSRRVFARSEMSNNPVRDIIIAAIKAGRLKNVDPGYATDLITSGAKAIFFWPKFLVGADSWTGSDVVIEDSVDMFLFRYGKLDDVHSKSVTCDERN